MPGFQELSDSMVSFINDGPGVSEVNDMVMGPRMMCHQSFWPQFLRSFCVLFSA